MEDLETPLYRVIGSRIKLQRQQKGLSQEDLSNIISISRASVSNIEVGRHQPPLHVLYEISEALQINIYALLPDLFEIKMASESLGLSDVLDKEDISDINKKSIIDIINDLNHDL